MHRPLASGASVDKFMRGESRRPRPDSKLRAAVSFGTMQASNIANALGQRRTARQPIRRAMIPR